jgi:hypothetical protein
MSDERQHRVEALGEQIVALLQPLTQIDREDVMAVVRAVYSKECWGKQPDGPRVCQCWNDE